MTFSATLFRIDKFVVPSTHREEFLARLYETHALIGKIDGCLQSHVLEQVSGPGKSNIATLVEWRDMSVYELARQIVQEHYRAVGFDPPSYMQAIGIEADLSTYQVKSLHATVRHASSPTRNEAANQ